MGTPHSPAGSTLHPFHYIVEKSGMGSSLDSSNKNASVGEAFLFELT
jgi:hypothetical protein